MAPNFALAKTEFHKQCTLLTMNDQQDSFRGVVPIEPVQCPRRALWGQSRPIFETPAYFISFHTKAKAD